MTSPPGVDGLNSSGISSGDWLAGPLGDEDGWRGPIGLGVRSSSSLEDGLDGEELEVEGGSLLVSWVGGPEGEGADWRLRGGPSDLKTGIEASIASVRRFWSSGHSTLLVSVG